MINNDRGQYFLICHLKHEGSATPLSLSELEISYSGVPFLARGLGV